MFHNKKKPKPTRSKVDGTYLVLTLGCLLPYTTGIGEVDISVRPQLYVNKPWSVAKVLELISNCYELCWLLKLESLANFEHMFQSLWNMSFECPILDLHLTFHHLNIEIRSR